MAPALAAEVTLTGRVFDAAEALRLGVVNEVVPEGSRSSGRCSWRPGSPPRPREATLETKRRILLDRERDFGPLFAEEARLFRETLLAGPDDDAA